MAVAKKGIFFTSIAILMSTLLIITFATKSTVTTKDQLPLTEAKAEAASSQVRELIHNYLPQITYAAGYNALIAMAEYISRTNSYFTDPDGSLKFNLTLKEIIYNGTMCCNLKGAPTYPTCNSNSLADVQNPTLHIGADECLDMTLMKDRNLTKRLQDMENASFQAYRVNTTFFRNYEQDAFSIYQNNQTGPWQVGINITVNYSVIAGDIMINNSRNISAIFDIQGMPDPLYAIGSQGSAEDGNILYTNYINKTNITRWNASSLYKLIRTRQYNQNQNGSSFLMRMYGIDERSPCCGIESPLNPITMANVNGMRERPYFDWCYYGQNNRCIFPSGTSSMFNVTCITTETDGTQFYRFATDTHHAIQYNLTSAQKDYLYAAGPPPSCPDSPFP